MASLVLAPGGELFEMRVYLRLRGFRVGQLTDTQITKLYAGEAQQDERRLCNAEVKGSRPFIGSRQ